MKSTRSNVPNVITQCVSSPLLTTLLSSAAYSNTCAGGTPYRINLNTPPATHRGRLIPPSHSPITPCRISPEWPVPTLARLGFSELHSHGTGFQSAGVNKRILTHLRPSRRRIFGPILIKVENSSKYDSKSSAPQIDFPIPR